MSLSTCNHCGGHIPLGPDASNRCESCGRHVFEPLPARTYRLLNRDERIEPGDQVLLDDASTWAPLDLHGIDRIAGNSNYDPGFHMPMRRPT